MGSFILFILWMVGLIVVSIELWGPSGSINGNCNLYVDGRQSTGASVETLAWLEQHSICKLPFTWSVVLLLWRRSLYSRITIPCGVSIIADVLSVAGQSWTAAWAFQLVGCVFLFWMMIMSYQVYQDDS
jgi:hypothetical protein